MKTLILYLLVTFYFSISATCQKSFNVYVELNADSPIKEMPKTLTFLPITLTYNNVEAKYSAKNVPPGVYLLSVGIVNNHRIDTSIVVENNVSNEHFIKLIKIPNDYSFDKDLKNENLRLLVNTSGPTVFEGTEVGIKMKSKFNVTVCSSYSCYSDNTDYGSNYSIAVRNYLDEQFGSKWRKELEKYELTPWE